MEWQILPLFFGRRPMQTLIKTKCPSCKTYLSVPQSQLNERDAKVRCERCQQIYLINNNLVVPSDATPIANDSKINIDKQKFNRVTETKASSKDQNDSLCNDNLIYDDMPIDESDHTDTKYDSLDDMEPWFSLLDAMPSTSSKDNKQPNTVLSKNSIENDELDSLVVRSDYIAKTSFQSTMSSAAANDINASVSTTNHRSDNENGWLEKLLEEQDDSDNTHIDNPKSTTDLSKLLASMGVPPNDQKPLNRHAKSNDLNSYSQTHKRPARSYPAQNRVQASAASVLWLAGCLVLVMLLFAQYVIFNLDHLVKNPAHAARLQAVCAIAVCSLPSADLTAFDVTDLVHRPSEIKAANGFSDISAILVNQSTKAQLLPTLKVGIYSSEVLVGEFLALPEDYLVSKQHRLPAEQNKPLMFTVPITDNQISRITIDPIY